MREALGLLEASTLQTFDDFDGTGTVHPKPADQRAKLRAQLMEITAGTCADLAVGAFGITVAAPINASRLDKTDVGLALLAIFARQGKAHKLNVLGRPYQSGPLEEKLGIQFTSEERAEAAKAIDRLIVDDLLRPTYTDIANPESWLEITEAGKAALAAGVIDELDAALLLLGQPLVDMRRGAYSALAATNPDSQRHAAFAARELLSQVLHALAPDEAVQQQPGFTGTVSRKARVRFILKGKGGEYSESSVDVTESLADLVQSLYAKLSAEAHGRLSARQAKHLVQTVDLILEALLL